MVMSTTGRYPLEGVTKTRTSWLVWFMDAMVRDHAGGPMDEQATPYANAVQWLDQGVKPAEVVTRLKASGLNGGALLGVALIVIGVGIFFVSGGRFIAYGMVIVGIMRVVRGMGAR
jgi:hypothetical protein